MKKFINRPENAVEEMLEGLTILSPGSDRLPGHRVMFRADTEQARDKQVAIVSGGGSGHEPAHAGYIGAGMLSAGVAGEVFTSPDTDSIFEAIKAVRGKAGSASGRQELHGRSPELRACCGNGALRGHPGRDDHRGR